MNRIIVINSFGEMAREDGRMKVKTGGEFKHETNN